MKPSLLTAGLALASGDGLRGTRLRRSEHQPDRKYSDSRVQRFHGALEPPTGSNGRIGDVAGGVEYLAAYIARLKENANTVVVRR
jgi:hypothetical protein